MTKDLHSMSNEQSALHILPNNKISFLDDISFFVWDDADESPGDPIPIEQDQGMLIPPPPISPLACFPSLTMMYFTLKLCLGRGSIPYSSCIPCFVKERCLFTSEPHLQLLML